MLASAAERRTSILAWAGLGYMALQFGFLARLTWWEYSWDIMEPVTYFVTYGTAIGAYAYYVLTRQVRLIMTRHAHMITKTKLFEECDKYIW